MSISIGESRWVARSTALMCVVLSMAAIRSWVGIFYWNQPISEWLSWVSVDPPYLPTDLVPATELLGNHFFGDYQEFRSWGVLWIQHGISPYEIGVSYPPLGVLASIPFVFVTPKVGYAAFAIVSAAGVLLPLWMLLRGVSPSVKVIVLSLFAVLTAPFLAVLDRGNTQGLTFCLIAFSLVSASRGKWWWTGALLAAAASLEISPLILILVPTVFGFIRFTIKTAAGAMAVSLLIMLTLPGTWPDNLTGFITNLLDFAGEAAPSKNFSTSGVVQQLTMAMHEIGWLTETERIHLWFSALTTLAWSVGLFLVLKRRRVPQWLWGGLSLATMQVLSPVSLPYSLLWAPLALVWFLRGSMPGISAKVPQEPIKYGLQESRLRWLWLSTLVILLAPLPILVPFGGVSINLLPTLGLVSLYFCMGYALLVSCRRATHRDHSNTSHREM